MQSNKKEKSVEFILSYLSLKFLVYYLHFTMNKIYKAGSMARSNEVWV